MGHSKSVVCFGSCCYQFMRVGSRPCIDEEVFLIPFHVLCDFDFDVNLVVIF